MIGTVSPPGLLARWFAEPLAPEQARGLLERAGRGVRHRHRAGLQLVTGRLQVMIAHHWLTGVPQPSDYDMALRAGLHNRRARALAELVYGQLLLSGKLAGAFSHLDAGFALATPLLKAQDYLAMRRRHILLRRLELGQVPVAPQGLDALLAEAGVIARLEGRPQSRLAHDPRDTSG